jgi:Fe2+ transport system protein FeoA
LKIIFNFAMDSNPTFALSELPDGESAHVHDLGMSAHIAEHLMNLGFIPGVEIMPARSAPGGDPRVYRVDGAEVAVRRELSRKIRVRRIKAER